MVRRGCSGSIAAALATGNDPGPPPLPQQATIAAAHVEAMLEQDGPAHGLRNARKHIGWYLAAQRPAAGSVKDLAAPAVHVGECPRAVLAGLATFYAEAQEAA